MVIVPIAALVSKRKGVNIEKANKFKDKRVEIITEVINGIKFTKLYGGENAFKKSIFKLRQKEIYYLKKVALGRSI